MTETPEQFVERCRAYAKAATSGPWECVPGGSVFCMHHDSERGKGCFILFDRRGYEGPECNLYGDGNFVANARTDLPAALSIIETLVAERDAAREKMKMLEAWQEFVNTKPKNPNPQIPFVYRPATGRTIPDLTDMEHVCKFQRTVETKT